MRSANASGSLSVDNFSHNKPDFCIDEFANKTVLYEMIRNSLKFLKVGLEGNETLDLMVDKSNIVNLSRHDLLLMNMLEGSVKIHDKKVRQN